MQRRLQGLCEDTSVRAVALVAAWSLVAAGCAASKAFRQGDAAMKAGDLDQAVAYYRTAAQASPDNPNYKIALQRAMLAASRAHFEKARAVRGAGSARGGARRVPAGVGIRPEQPAGGGQGARARSDHPRAHRGGAAAAGDRAAARARARRRPPSRCSIRRRASRCACSSATPASATSSTRSAAPTGINITYDPTVPQTADDRRCSTA